MSTIALLGIPIMWSREEQLQVSIPTATDQPRSDLERILRENVSGIEIVDLGELTTPTEIVSDGDYKTLGSKARDLIHNSKANTVLVIGGDHASALPFYHLRGQKVRADAHGDAYVFDPSASVGVYGGNYMFHVEQRGLNHGYEVLNVGINTNGIGNWGIVGKSVDIEEILGTSKPSNTAFLDIDVDVLSRNYLLPHGESTSNLLAKDLAKLITGLKPSVIGLFECVGNNGYIPPNIVSRYPRVFTPIVRAVGQLALSQTHQNSY